MTLLIAHAGCEGTANGSMESLYAAVNSGADAIEVDLRLSNNKIIYAHDISEVIYDDFIKFDRILDFLAGSGPLIACDIKTEETFLPALETIVQRNMDERVIFSGKVPVRHRHTGRYRYCINVECVCNIEDGQLLTERNIRSLIRYYNQHRSENLAGFNVNYHWITPKIVRQFQEAGINLWVWTVDDPEAVQWLLACEVSGITTNKIVTAIALAANNPKKTNGNLMFDQ